MNRTTLTVALSLVALGVGFYAATNAASPTALLPTALGILLLACWFVARTGTRRPHATHVALGVALIGALGSLTNVIKLPELISGNAARPNAIVESVLMCLLLVGYLALGLGSFLRTRRARRSQATAAARRGALRDEGR